MAKRANCAVHLHWLLWLPSNDSHGREMGPTQGQRDDWLELDVSGRHDLCCRCIVICGTQKKKALLNENITADLFIPQFRIPERWRPGSFDVWGASHQIFHVCAVLGAALHYKGLLKGFDYNHSPSSRQC